MAAHLIHMVNLIAPPLSPPGSGVSPRTLMTREQLEFNKNIILKQIATVSADFERMTASQMRLKEEHEKLQAAIETAHKTMVESEAQIKYIQDQEKEKQELEEANKRLFSEFVALRIAMTEVPLKEVSKLSQLATQMSLKGALLESQTPKMLDMHRLVDASLPVKRRHLEIVEKTREEVARLSETREKTNEEIRHLSQTILKVDIARTAFTRGQATFEALLQHRSPDSLSREHRESLKTLFQEQEGYLNGTLAEYQRNLENLQKHEIEIQGDLDALHREMSKIDTSFSQIERELKQQKDLLIELQNQMEHIATTASAMQAKISTLNIKTQKAEIRRLMDDIEAQMKESENREDQLIVCRNLSIRLETNLREMTDQKARLTESIAKQMEAAKKNKLDQNNMKDKMVEIQENLEALSRGSNYLDKIPAPDTLRLVARPASAPSLTPASESISSSSSSISESSHSSSSSNRKRSRAVQDSPPVRRIRLLAERGRMDSIHHSMDAERPDSSRIVFPPDSLHTILQSRESLTMGTLEAFFTSKTREDCEREINRVESGFAPIHLLLQQPNLDLAAAFIHKYNPNLRIKAQGEWLPLELAFTNSNFDTPHVIQLIKAFQTKGISLIEGEPQEGRRSRNYLNLSIYYGFSEIAIALLKFVNPDQFDGLGLAAIHYIAITGNHRILQYLADQSRMSCPSLPYFRNATISSSGRRMTQSINLFNLPCQTERRANPLMYAANFAESTECIDILLRSCGSRRTYTDLDYKDAYGNTCLDYASHPFHEPDEGSREMRRREKIISRIQEDFGVISGSPSSSSSSSHS